MAMKTKKQKSPAYVLRIYIGYGDRGAAKELAIRRSIASTGQNISKVVVNLLKEKFPSIGL